MKTSPVTPQDLGGSVIAVPPLALTSDLSADIEENRKILKHLHAGGVTSYLYGGNANFFAIPVSEYAYNETRYRMLLQSNESRAEALMKLAQKDVTSRWKLYEQMAAMHYGSNGNE